MPLVLKRVDYVQLESVTSGSVGVVSGFSEKSQQKVAVGDLKGTLQLISVKKGELITDFKYNLGQPINAAKVHNNEGNEVILIATGSTVKGFSKKGKPVLTMETNLVEPILFLEVTESDDFIVCSSHVYSQYRSSKEVNYFMSPEKINAVAVLPASKVPLLTPLLACSDRSIYSLRESSIRHVLRISGIPTCLKLFCNHGGNSGELVVFGTSCGTLGLARFSRAGPSILWVQQPARGSLSTGINSIDFFDIDNSGIDDKMIVGRDDGYVEVYKIHAEEDEAHQLPRLIFSMNCSDCIAVVRGGFFSKSEVEEILVVTQHGWLFTLTTDSTAGDAFDSVTSARQPKSGLRPAQQKILDLRNEVEDLQEKVLLQRSKFQNESGTSVNPTALQIMYKLSLVSEEMVYLLSLESPVSIDYCLIHCDNAVQFIDVDRNSAVLSMVKSTEGKNETMATYRCQFNTTRLDVKIRCREGSCGTLVRFYTVPNLQPKFAVTKTLRIPALCLHARIHEPESNPMMHKLTLKGDFSLATIHSWIGLCLPEVPEKLPVEDEGRFSFEHCFFKHRIVCEYRKTEAVFLAENPASLDIIRNFVTKEATKSNLVLSISADVKLEPVRQLLSKMAPFFKNQFEISRQNRLVSALKEVALEQTSLGRSSDWITKEFQEILDKEKELGQTDSRLQYFTDFLVEVLTSFHEFHGRTDVLDKSHQLRDLLARGAVDQISELFSL